MATQASSEVRTRSRARLELSGRVLVNAFANSHTVNNVDVPQNVLPVSTLPRGGRSGGVVARQTTFAAVASGLQLLGGEARADAVFDLYGGQTGATRPLFPLPRLRILRGIVRWERTELLVGQDVPLIAQWNPESVASIGTPNFATAGNLWNWLPQLRLTQELAGGERAEDGTRALGLAVQGAVIAPVAGGDIIVGAPVDAAEASQRPFLQARLRVGWGSDERPGEFGVGVHRGWLQSGDSLVSSQAVAADFLLPFAGIFDVRGEMYVGQLLRGLGGGGVGQNFGAGTGIPPFPTIIEDRGGWAQLNVRPVMAHALGAGCGVDDPNDDDQPTILRNFVCATYWNWRPGGGPFLVGLEYRRLETTYRNVPTPARPSPRRAFRSDHFNLAVGLEF